MRYKPFNKRANRVNRLAQKIGKRLDRENPKRKMRKMVAALLAIGLLLLSFFVNQNMASEVVLVALPFVLVAEECLRLKGRAPRRKWREVMLITGTGVAVFAFMTFVMWQDGTEPTFVWAFASLAVVLLLLFSYAVWRFVCVKREVAEEKEQLWRRYERQKRLEKLNSL